MYPVPRSSGENWRHIVQRPFVSHSIDDLEDAFERAERAGDPGALGLLARELEFRKTPRARDLKDAVAKALALAGNQ
jgi:hypothetical protein